MKYIKIFFVSLITLSLISSITLAAIPSFDDFEEHNQGEDPDGWTELSGNWYVDLSDSNKVYHQDSPAAAGPTTVAGNSSWSNYSLVVRVKAPVNFTKKPNEEKVGIYAHYNSTEENYYSLDVFYDGTVHKLRLTAVKGGVEQASTNITTSWQSNTWYYLRLTVYGNTIEGKFWMVGDDESTADVVTLSLTDSQVVLSGKIGLFTKKTKADFDNVQVDEEPAPPIPLFPLGTIIPLVTALWIYAYYKFMRKGNSIG